MLEVRIESRGYEQPVLGEVFASIKRGDRICLLGPSGIGKTTLLNAIAGLDTTLPAAAVIGRENLRIGYLFQEHRLLPWRSLLANLKLVGVSEQDAKSLLGQVGLAGCEDYLPDQISLGMARRAALARCLAVKPDLLLLDEPFASLDPVMATDLKSLISSLMDDHPDMAMICVTHDANDASILANRLWYLDGKPATLQWDDEIADSGLVDGLLKKLRMPESAVF